MGSLEIIFYNNRTKMSSQKSVQCIMCPKSLKVRLIANHLQNVHKIEQKSVLLFSKLQLKVYKKFNKVLQKKEKKSSCQRLKEKRQSERTKLLNKFETCIQNQYLNEDLFSKLLLDVSMKYHQRRITNRPMDYDDIKPQEEKMDKRENQDKNLSLIINLKEKRVVTKQKKDIVDKSKVSDKTLKVKKPLKKPRAPKLPKLATSTPKPRARKTKVISSTNATARTIGG